MFKYLREQSYYEDLYDRMTIKECLSVEKSFLSSAGKEVKGIKVEQAQALQMTNLMLHFVTGERYLKRSQTINEWIKRDSDRDKKLHETPLPEVECRLCRSSIDLLYKRLVDRNNRGNKEELEWTFKCEPCEYILTVSERNRREERILWQCPQCKRRKNIDSKREGNLIIRDESCICGYQYHNEFDLSDEKKDKTKEKKERERFFENKARFCLSGEEGEQYRQTKRRQDEFIEMSKAWKARDDARLEKLKKFPKGFHLEDDGSYSCCVCYQTIMNKETWFDQYGIKCLLCQEALETKVIPPSVCEDKESWYSSYDFRDRCGLYNQTVLKLIRQKKIKARIILNKAGKPHKYIFLKKENPKLEKIDIGKGQMKRGKNGELVFSSNKAPTRYDLP